MTEFTVSDTNTEATISKLSAIDKGYFKDPFVKDFVSSHKKKDVIINRGYWCRHTIFQDVVNRFIAAYPGKKQIVSLGSGYDTTFFNIMQQGKATDLFYVEVDLPVVVKHKIEKMQRSKQICELLVQPQTTEAKDALRTQNYLLFSQDLCDTEKFFQRLNEYGLRNDVPTLFIVECVFTYIETESTNTLIKRMSSQFTKSFFLNYEMFNPNDPFGRMMVKNFESIGCSLVGIFKYPTLESQIERMKSFGFFQTEIYTMLNIYTSVVNQVERNKIEQIEFLDELEEWNIMQSHYFVCLSSNLGLQKEEEKQEWARVQMNKNQQ